MIVFDGCSTLYAPGENIVSAWADGVTSEMTLTGSSAAAALVAGHVAGLMTQVDADQVLEYI